MRLGEDWKKKKKKKKKRPGTRRNVEHRRFTVCTYLHSDLKKILDTMLDLSLFGAISERGTATMPFNGLGPREMNYTRYEMIGTSLSTPQPRPPL